MSTPIFDDGCSEMMSATPGDIDFTKLMEDSRKRQKTKDHSLFAEFRQQFALSNPPVKNESCDELTEPIGRIIFDIKL